MRLSRKAGLLACGVRWDKYECSKNSRKEYDYSETAWDLISAGVVDQGDSMTGWTSYTFGRVSNTYQYLTNGSKVTITAPATGTVYRPYGTYVEKEVWYESAGGLAGELYKKTISTITSWEEYYDIGNRICSVRAAEGEYPDAKKGYTFVGTEDGYTIMHDSDGNYFAYKKIG